MNKETTPKEQSILSIEDRSEKYALSEWGLKEIPIEETVSRDRFDNSKDDFIAGVNEMLPIIKELGEALKEINDLWKSETSISSLVEKMDDLEPIIQTTLDKYKQYL